MFQIQENIAGRTHQHIDARSKARYCRFGKIFGFELQICLKLFSFFCRFDGTVPEPRKGIRSGHVPGSKCVPFAQVCINISSLCL